MKYRRLAPAAFTGLVVLASCFGGPPAAPVAATLGPTTGGSGPRAQAPFAVVFAGPRGTVRDLQQPAITVVFNRAVHDPETDETTAVPAIRVVAGDGRAVAGAWRWVGSHGLVFTPDSALPGSTAFSVAVPAGTKALDGASFGGDYRFDFTTARPEIARSLPEDGATNVRLTSAFGIVFNQPMDPAVVASAARVVARPDASPTATPSAPKPLAFHASHPTVGPDRAHTVLLTTDAPLPLDTPIDVVLAKGLHGDGPLGTTEAHTLSFRTYGPIRLVDVRCPRATGPRCQAHRDFTMVLSSAVDPAEFRAHFKAPSLPRAAPVRVAPPTDPKARTAKPLPSTEQRLAADPGYGKRYHLTVTAGMRDVFGQTLDHELSVDVDTEAPFIAAGKPVLGPSAVASANPAPTAPDDSANESSDDSSKATVTEPAPPSPDDPRPHRAQLAYDLTIGLQGHVIEALAAQGLKSHKVPIGATNIPSYAMTASRLREDEALAWLDRTAHANGSEGPPWRWTWVNPGVPENVRSVRDVDLDTLLGGVGSRGAALLAVAQPGSMDQPKMELVTVTDLAVSAKMSRYGGLVWVTRLSTGTPVEGATISVRKANKPELFTATTDASGLAAVPADRYAAIDEHGAIDRDACLFVHKDTDWTYQRLERAAASYRSSVGVDLAQRGEWAGMLYTDRGVYRPGEAIKLAGVFRHVDAAGIKASPGEAVRVAMTDDSGETVFDGRAVLDAFGEILLDVPIPKTAHLGSARIVAAVGRKDGESFEHEVLLAAYKASEFKVGVDADKTDYVRGDAARFDIHAEYLFGAPMGKASLHNYASRSRTEFKPPHAEAFATSDEAGALDHPETNPSADDLQVEDGALDEDGRAFEKLDLALPRMVGPEEVTFTTEVEDLTHQTVAHRAVVRVHPAAFYVGMQRASSRFLAVGASVPVGVAAIDPAGQRVAGVPTKVDLVLRSWTSVALDEAAAVPQRRSKMVDTVVASCDVTTTTGPVSCPLKVTQPGYYLLRARAKDSRGNDVGASSSFYCVDDRSDAPATTVAWSDPAGRAVQLETDKKQYEIGDVARVLVRNPFKKADALVTVERAGVLWSRVVTLEGPTPVVDVPVAPEYFPNAFIAVHLVRGRVQAPPAAGGADLGAPDFRLGMAPIGVNPESHRLAVQVVTDRKEYRPGDEVTADVSVADRNGRAPRAAVTFYAVDEGVLMLTSYATPDPLPPFTADRSLAVFDVESREALARILPMKNGERIKPLGYEFLEPPSSEDKGGNGGGGGGGDVRADFKTTAYFEAGRVTSAEGRTRYRFKLPDNLTTFRLMAIVASDDRFGKGESTVTTSRRLMARPALPRIVRVGDTFEAGVIVSSRDLGATEATVTLAAKGVTLAGPATKRVNVPSGGSVEVRFPVKAEVPGKATFEMAVAGAGEQDRVRVEREVTLPLNVETTAVYGETTAASAVAFGDLRGMRRDQGGLEVHLASTALVGLKTSFDRALDYPYGCTEQLTSRILPLLLLPEMARQFGARMPAKVDDVVDDAIGALLTHQGGSGGFSFWEDGEAVPWLSAYAMLAVEVAANKGFFVPKAARDRGVDYLRQVLDRTSIGDADEPPAANAVDDVPLDPDTHDAAQEKPARAYATLAFIADVLATIGQPDPGYLNRLFDARAGRPLFAQALLLHAMVTGHMPAAEIDVLAKTIESRIRVDAGSAFVDESETLEDDLLDSSSRTTALVLRALVAAQPAHPLAARLARGLLDHRVGGAWRSTQENVWALLALGDYRRAAESAAPSFEARVFLGDDVVGQASFLARTEADALVSVAPQRLADRGDQPLTFEVKGQGKLFYSAELTYALTALPDKPAGEGLFLQKRMRALRPDELAAAQALLPRHTDASAPVGDLVLVDLLLESPEPHEQVVVDDPLPAGLEPVDFALDTAVSNIAVAPQNAADPADRRPGRDYGAFRDAVGLHRELHDDRVLTFLPHVDPGLYHFRYLARATTPGDFVVPPSRAECMYSPEVRGRTAATRFSVTPAPPKTPGQRPRS